MTRLIDADALKEEVNKKKVVGRFNTLLLIDDAPTVEPVAIWHNWARRNGKVQAILNEIRPKGKWIEHYSKEMSEKGYYLCSRCKCGFQRFERGVRHSDLPWIDGQKYELHCIDNFCPNCGTDMRPKTHIRPKDEDDTWKEDMQRDADDYLASQGGDDK